MPKSTPTPFVVPRLSLWRRLAQVTGSTALGLALTIAVLVLYGRPGSAQAAPLATLRVFPGCAATLQACLDASADGDSIDIASGTYITSLTMSKAVTLTGGGAQGAGATILKAMPGQRVLTVTSAVTQPFTIGSLGLTGGNVTGDGGAVSSLSLGAMLLQDVTISNSKASNVGGGLSAAGPVTLANVTFLGNTATSNGGAASVQTATVNGGQFILNTCIGFCTGGGIWANAALTLNGVSFYSNTAQFNGGGAGSDAAIAVNGGLFQNNVSLGTGGGRGGGGLIAYGNTVAVISGTNFISNSTTGYGGALQTYYSATLTNVVFLSNSATISISGGAGAYVNGLANLSGVSFTGNAPYFSTKARSLASLLLIPAPPPEI